MLEALLVVPVIEIFALIARALDYSQFLGRVLNVL